MLAPVHSPTEELVVCHQGTAVIQLPSICLRLAATAAKACRNSGILHAHKLSEMESNCIRSGHLRFVSIIAETVVDTAHLSTTFGHQLPGPASGTSFGGNLKKI